MDEEALEPEKKEKGAKSTECGAKNISNDPMQRGHERRTQMEFHLVFKRKRSTTKDGGPDVAKTVDTVDPYGIRSHVCCMDEHHPSVSLAKKAGPTTGKKHRAPRPRRNCVDNPNCLFGLGEHTDGIWKSTPSVLADLGPDPSENLRCPSDDNNNAIAVARPCGLRNLGATCYVNSMVQCLFMNLSFRRAVHEWEPKQTQHVNAALLAQMHALQRLFAQMQLGALSYVDPQDFAATLELNNVMQQDAHEFTKLFLTHLQSIFVYSKHRVHWNHIDTHFRGSMHYVTTCSTCCARSTRSSSYYEISLNIKGHPSVHDSFQSYLSPELLYGDNQYFCDACASKQDATRQIEIEESTLPPTLMLHLMRFVYDVKTYTKKKVQDAIEIPLTLNTRDLVKQAKQANAQYRLVGVLNHRGSTASAGHYTANIFNPTSNQWFAFDDTNVEEMQPSAFGASKEAYMLIYTREDHLVATDEVLPAPALIHEVETANARLQQDVATHRAKMTELHELVAIRKVKYDFHFETPVPESPFYWVDAAHLQEWVLGTDIAKDTAPVMDLEPYLCEHNKLHPNKSHRLKRVSLQLYRELCSSATTPIELSSHNYWCDECVVLSQRQSLVSLGKQERWKRNLELLNHTEEAYLISRKWVSSWKICLQDALAIKQPGAKVDEAQEWMASMTINQDLACSHGNLQPKKRPQYRSISSDLWAVLASEYAVGATFPKPTTSDCVQCMDDASTQHMAETMARNDRNRLLAEKPALFRLFKRQASSPHDVLPTDKPLALVSHAWLEQWKAYIDHVHVTAPTSLPNAFQCEHDKCVVPMHILDQIERRGHKKQATVDAAVVLLDEWNELSQVYTADAPLSFILHGNGDVQWGKINKVRGFVAIPAVRCSVCELKQETNQLALSLDFQNQPVNIIALREEEAIPNGLGTDTDVASDQPQRRRSSRSGRKTNPTYEVCCSADDTVSLLKHRLFETCDTAPSHQLLYFRGELLDNATSLKHAGIQAHDTLYLKALTDETPDDVLEIVTNEVEVGFEHSAIAGHRRQSVAASWVCDTCTLVNDTGAGLCEMCDAERPAATLL
ncbi:Aste57867_10741 [Aphanomyces stellatus]|uniref:ubiquitinyl hydrolase 1 n=1 Tax=Aphanomyces stellatus TaxID=120398 RepID=A0A485KRV7_9STRA|nr:hypothetical protein As57867_010701 [Aphanomyces stellatus]VFT87611.1 Aste57867_10741 [Aphanomyces stellatus]